jgi:hypothetical protein
MALSINKATVNQRRPRLIKIRRATIRACTSDTNRSARRADRVASVDEIVRAARLRSIN